jgi:hypothetical protein
MAVRPFVTPAVSEIAKKCKNSLACRAGGSCAVSPLPLGEGQGEGGKGRRIRRCDATGPQRATIS